MNNLRIIRMLNINTNVVVHAVIDTQFNELDRFKTEKAAMDFINDLDVLNEVNK